MSQPKITVFEGERVSVDSVFERQWYYRVLGGNGEILVVSEAYTREEDAERGADTLLAVCGELLWMRKAESQTGPTPLAVGTLLAERGIHVVSRPDRDRARPASQYYQALKAVREVWNLSLLDARDVVHAYLDERGA